MSRLDPVDAELVPWWEPIAALLTPDGEPLIYDADTAIGANDPDRRHRTAAELLAGPAPLGARGIKLHPRAERFSLDEPVVAGLAALARSAARRS